MFSSRSAFFIIAACLLTITACGRENIPTAPQTFAPNATGATPSNLAPATVTGAVPRHRLLFVANTRPINGAFVASIEVYRLFDTGNVAPRYEIIGPHTGLVFPQALAFGPHGELYVLNFTDSPNINEMEDVLEFAPGANGDATPVRTITCGGMVDSAGIAVYRNGTVAVSSAPDAPNYGISLFPPGSSGCVAGNQMIAGPAIDSTTADLTKLGDPTGLAIDRRGNLFALNSADDFGTPSITEYAPNSVGNVAPIRTIAGPSTHLSNSCFIPFNAGIALDRDGNIFVAQGFVGPGEVLEFQSGAQGDAPPIRDLNGDALLAARVTGITVGPGGRIFVTDQISKSILEFTKSANGAAAPISQIGGSKTHLDQPYALAVLP